MRQELSSRNCQVPGRLSLTKSCLFEDRTIPRAYATGIVPTRALKHMAVRVDGHAVEPLAGAWPAVPGKGLARACRPGCSDSTARAPAKVKPGPAIGKIARLGLFVVAQDNPVVPGRLLRNANRIRLGEPRSGGRCVCTTGEERHAQCAKRKAAAESIHDARSHRTTQYRLSEVIHGLRAGAPKNPRCRR